MYQADRAWRFVLKQKKLSEIVKEVERALKREDGEKTADWFRERV
jgi:hypothetical protein